MSIDVKTRLTERINRSRLELELRRSVRPFIASLVGLAIGLACAIWILSNLSRTTLSKTNTVRFAVDNASAVVQGRNQVRFKGIAAGDIVKSEYVDGQAVLTVKIQRKFGKIYRDARAELRPDTPLEDMHLDIVSRGTPAAGVANGGEPLAKAQTSSQVQIENVLDMFQPDVRNNFRSLLANLGQGLDDRGDSMREAFAQSVPLLKAADGLSDQLASRKKIVARLVTNSAELTTDLGDREELLRNLLRDGSTTVAALQQERGNLDATLAELPPTMRVADTSLAALGGVLGDVDTAVTKLRPAARELPGGLEGVRRLSATLGPAARDLKRPVKDLVPLSASLPPLASRLNTAFRTITPQTPVLARGVKDLVDCEDGVTQFMVWQPTAGVFDDKRGTMLRADVQLSALAAGISTPRRNAIEGCTKSPTLGGRPAKPEDEH